MLGAALGGTQVAAYAGTPLAITSMLGAALGGTQVAVALEHLADIPAVPDGRGGHQNGCLLRRTTLPGQHAHQSWALAG